MISYSAYTSYHINFFFVPKMQLLCIEPLSYATDSTSQTINTNLKALKVVH